MRSLLRVWLVAYVALGCACATAPTVGEGFAGDTRTHEGWRQLLAGDAVTAQKSFTPTSPVANATFDPFAVFGRALISYEHGQTDAALGDALMLLRAANAPSGDDWSRWLATAATSWLGTLVYESSTWANRVDDLQKLLGPGLPWLARFELMQVADDTARRAGRVDAVAGIALAANCSPQASVVGTAGYRPVLDLLATGGKRPQPKPVLVSGCRFTVPPDEALPGVRVVNATVDVASAGDHDIALEYRGLAAMRVNGGAWHLHGGAELWGPHRSALRASLAKGKHTVELRLSTYGGGADFWLAAFAANAHEDGNPPATLTAMPRELVGPLAALSNVLVARLHGDWNAGLLQAQRLQAHPKFALGLIEAGRLLESEPTRPDNVTRDNARSVWRKAVALDPVAVRARLALSALENLEGRPREATAFALQAKSAAPAWWPAALAAHETLNTEGIEDQADRALDEALVLVRAADSTPAAWACPVVEAALRRARVRDQLAKVDPLLQRQRQCEARDVGWATRLVERGELGNAAKAYQSVVKLSSSSQWLIPEHASSLAASGDVAGAVSMMKTQVARWPREPGFLLRLANFQAQAGLQSDSRGTVAQAVRQFPASAEVRQAARAMFVPMPGDADREPGLAVIAAFLKSGHKYDAPAVFVLDRLVERVFADGSRTLLTHSIVRVQSKDALDRWGEVNVPAGAEVLTLRTVKPDLSVREPEDIFGKESISAPELQAGDFVEWETLESIEPSAAFGGGFVSHRFYFQSNEAPLERSEYVIISPQGRRLDLDARSGAPKPSLQDQPEGLVKRTFVALRVPQVFPERAAVAALHWIPSVRVSCGVDQQKWAGVVADRLSAVARVNPAVQDVAGSVLASAGGDSSSAWARAVALMSWVTTNIEAEGGADETASFAVARGRGNRFAVALALAKLLKVDAEPVLVRPLTVAAKDEVSSPQESTSFSEVLLRFPGLNRGKVSTSANATGPDVFVDPRLRYAPFGYVPPSLNGAAALRLADGSRLQVASIVDDVRLVRLSIAVNGEGDASISAREHLVGSAAIEWAEALHQLGADEDKRRRRFEEAYLSYHFPGATLQALAFKTGDGVVDIEYQLAVEGFATKSGATLSVEPRFFLAQPGKRYATEVARKTTLQLGPDTPLDLEAKIAFPKDAQILNAGYDLNIAPAAGLAFSEQRQMQNDRTSVVLRRRSTTPVARISRSLYPTMSGSLRKVDLAEQAAIHVRLKQGAP